MTAPTKKKLTPEQLKKFHAKFYISPEVSNAGVVVAFNESYLDKEIEYADVLDVINDITQQLTQENTLEYAERLLMSQGMALNNLFVSLVKKAETEDTNIKRFETFMRLALKSQSQCRATLETLAAVKNPPVVFANTANIAQNQQINNGTPPANDCQNKPIQITQDESVNIPVKSTDKVILETK